MPPTRREALAQLAALVSLPLPRWAPIPDDPLRGTVAEYQAGRRRRAWSAVEVTAAARTVGQFLIRQHIDEVSRVFHVHDAPADHGQH